MRWRLVSDAWVTTTERVSKVFPQKLHHKPSFRNLGSAAKQPWQRLQSKHWVSTRRRQQLCSSKEQQRNAAAHEMIGSKDLQKFCACAHFSMKQVCPDHKSFC